METKKTRIIDANEAVAEIAYRLNEVLAIYPITPSSPMGEWADAWEQTRKTNLWGAIPRVVEMQSEAGAIGAIHGALQTGALATTFTSSQGLLLMIPTLYKIAGELTSFVMHVAARTVATHALSIFCDHSDVMATRMTGVALLSSGSVQEAQDFALISQAATLQARVPLLHFFDGFRTSHEIANLEILSDDVIKAMISEDLIRAHRQRALNPDNPVLRGSAQNPDVFFQSREATNPYYTACADIIEEKFEQFAKLTGRRYKLYEYHGDPNADRIIVVMGSAGETVHETVKVLNARGEKLGVLVVRLYRPWDKKRFLASLPKTVKKIAVLDRTKEPGSSGEPLYLDVVSAFLEEAKSGVSVPEIISGRYGLSSKEFTPAMSKAIFDHLKEQKLKPVFTIGIQDDLTNLSLDYDPEFSIENPKALRALFYGLGSDGTVGANKNSVKIMGENTSLYAQGYFVYDSKKAGAVTISHLRFSPEPIRAPYLIEKAQFIAVHHNTFLERYSVLESITEGGTFLLNTSYGAEEIWDQLPEEYQKIIIDKKVKFYCIDASHVAREIGMPRRINTLMQTCFFALANLMPKEKALDAIRAAIRKTYAKKGEEIVMLNLKQVDSALDNLVEVHPPQNVTSKKKIQSSFPVPAPDFESNVLGKIAFGLGDSVPVSACSADGTFPTGTARLERRNLAEEIPVWDPAVCIQCGKCAMVCPHAVIRIKAYTPDQLAGAPETFKSSPAKDLNWKDLNYTIQVAPEDCTGCAICVDICPAKNKAEAGLKAINMRPQPPLVEEERKNWDFFLNLPELDRSRIQPGVIRQEQLQEPLFEFSGACAGCGETPYIKLATQLYGDRMVVANATGCSSIFGGNLPTTPWTKNKDGRGPAWNNSLFENNAEFGLGMRLGLDHRRQSAEVILKTLSTQIGETLVAEILNADQTSEAGIFEQRQRVKALKEKLKTISHPDVARLLSLADDLVKKSVWIIGGDGWGYDIGYGGLDHVFSTNADVNILVLDTEVYSNTGGQMSKATPRGAVAKFAAGGKTVGKKDLGWMAMSYGHVYVAEVAMGAKDEHTLRSFIEAESYQGPSLIIAYSHCIAHGIDMTLGMKHQKALVDSGQWLLYRYDPRRELKGETPLILDSLPPRTTLESSLYMENRFKMLTKSHPEVAKKLMEGAQQDAIRNRQRYELAAQKK